jgi:hypothetical protein
MSDIGKYKQNQYTIGSVINQNSTNIKGNNSNNFEVKFNKL